MADSCPRKCKNKDCEQVNYEQKMPSVHSGYRNFDKFLFHIYVDFNNKQIFTFHTSCSVQQDLGLVCSHSVLGTPFAQHGAGRRPVIG